MQIPNVPTAKLVGKDGFITEEWNAYFSNLSTLLSQNLSDEGYAFPPQSNDNVLQLNTVDSSRRIIYNADIEKMMLNNDGTFKEILTS
jgi:hypothetical protein